MAPYTEQERAQQSAADRAALWSAYFALKSVQNPPPVAVEAKLTLRGWLKSTKPHPAPPAPPSPDRGGRRLTLVGGER